MKIKERIIRQALTEAVTEIGKIDHILSATPITDIIKLQRDSIDTAKKMKPGLGVVKYLEKQMKKEKALFRLAKKQENSIALIDRKVELMSELYELKNELFYIERTSE